MLPSSTFRVTKMDETHSERVDGLDLDLDWLVAAIKADGIATRRHMDIVNARNRAEIRAILERCGLVPTRSPVSRDPHEPADLANDEGDS